MKIEITANDEYDHVAQEKIFDEMIKHPKFWILSNKKVMRSADFIYINNYEINNYGDIETIPFLRGSEVQSGVWYIYLRSGKNLFPKPKRNNEWMKQGYISSECTCKPLLHAIIAGVFTTYRGENGFSIRGNFSF